MNLRPQFSSGIRSKILLLAIVPVLSISAILTLYHISWHGTQLTEELEHYGRSTAGYLSVAGQLALFAEDEEALRQIALGAAGNANVDGVAFFRADGSRLLTLGEVDFPVPLHSAEWPGNQNRGEQTWCFRAPVELEALEMADYGELGDGDGDNEVLGWAVVGLSQRELKATQQENVWVGSLLAIFVTLLVSILAWALSHRIYQPIRDLTDIVETMEDGDLSVEAEVAGEREVQTLARVINRLASNLNQSNIRLKQEVDDATADLRLALADLEEALGAKDQFLARMSHELRTPLTTILGFTRRLDHTPLNAEQSEYQHAIRQSSLLLLSVINDILDFSRLQYGGIALEAVEFDLEQQLEDVVTLHSYNAYEKSIELITLIDSDVPHRFSGDAVRLKQVLNNLLANAVKFTDTGEIVVQVGTSNPDDPESSGEQVGEEEPCVLQFQVQDSGIGIPAEDMEKLFQPFSQADTSINRRFGGSGLGLVICQQLVEMMGGEIDIESEPGEGTIVRFTVQLQQLADIHSQLSLPSRQEPVALLDSNPWSRRALRSQLTHWTRQVFTLPEPDQLVEIICARQQVFSAVLINLGPGALEEPWLQETLVALRKCYSGPMILLACMSNIPDTIPRRLRQDFSPLWCLSKPVGRSKLIERLDIATQADGNLPDSRPAKEKATAAGCLQGQDILVAEDNHFNQVLIRRILEAEGARIITADDGAQAVEKFKQSNCSLVLLDVHMPQVDGVEACRRIVAAAAESGRPVSVVGLTADTLDVQRESFLLAGASEILYKPVDEKALLEALCRYAGCEFGDAGSSAIVDDRGLRTAMAQEANRLLASLRRALETGQLVDSRETIHQLLGLSGMSGMDEFRQTVLVVRDGLAELSQDTIQEKLDALDALLEANSDQDDPGNREN